jgi:hypothetical protein
MSRYGARILTVSAAQALSNSKLLEGPLRLCGWSLADGATPQALTVDQSAAAPGAGATIATINLNNGAFIVEWTLELTGTPAAGDVDNVQLFIGATLIDTSVNPGAVGNYPQEEVQPSVSFGLTALAWKTIGAATAGSVYKVQANIAQVNAANATIFDGAQAVGFPSMPPGSAQTVWFEKYGVQVRNSVSVQATLGTISGVLYYTMMDGLDPDDQQPRE